MADEKLSPEERLLNELLGKKWPEGEKFAARLTKKQKQLARKIMRGVIKFLATEDRGKRRKHMSGNEQDSAP